MKSVSHLTLETHIISYTMINLGNKNKCVAKGCWVNFYLDISVFWVVAYWIKSKKVIFWSQNMAWVPLQCTSEFFHPFLSSTRYKSYDWLLTKV